MNAQAPNNEPDNQAVRSLLQGLHASQHDRFWKWFSSSKQFLNGTALVKAKIEALNAEVAPSKRCLLKSNLFA